MAKDVLVGSTGFVGGNLLASHPFALALHSSDIQRGFEEPHERVVYAGVPSAMFLANAAPEEDLALMKTARENLRRLRPRQPVLISSIAVYADSRGRREEDDPAGPGLSAYGANRLQLERWVREDFENALILRLPALYGKGLKKNFLYDLHTLTPALLRADKYRELARQSEAVRLGYEEGANGFYRQNGAVSAGELKRFFAGSEFNALAFTHSESQYQFYPLSRLWKDIELALASGLRLVNLATPPVKAGEVYHFLTGKAWANETAAPPFAYDLHSQYAPLLGGAGEYLCTRQEELAQIAAFMKGWAETEKAGG